MQRPLLKMLNTIDVVVTLAFGNLNNRKRMMKVIMNLEQGTSNNEVAARVRTSEFPDLLITRKSTIRAIS